MILGPVVCSGVWHGVCFSGFLVVCSCSLLSPCYGGRRYLAWFLPFQVHCFWPNPPFVTEKAPCSRVIYNLMLLAKNSGCCYSLIYNVVSTSLFCFCCYYLLLTYLKSRLAERESSLCWLALQMAIVAGAMAGPKLGTPPTWPVWSQASFHCFPRHIIRRSGAGRTQTDTRVGCWCCCGLPASPLFSF